MRPRFRAVPLPLTSERGAPLLPPSSGAVVGSPSQTRMRYGVRRDEDPVCAPGTRSPFLSGALVRTICIWGQRPMSDGHRDGVAVPPICVRLVRRD